MQYNPSIGKKSLTQCSETSYKTFLLLTKASKTHQTPQNLLITNVKNQSTCLLNNKIKKQTKTIHSPGFEKKRSRIKTLKNDDSCSQLPLTQRMNILRVNKCNQFNRRSFQLISPQKNSFYGKAIRKCSSVLMKFQIEKVAQNMVQKKKLTLKPKSFRQQQQFLEELKNSLKVESETINNASKNKKIIILKASNPLKASKLSLNQANIIQNQKHKNSLRQMHVRLKRVLEEDSGLRPWGETKRIIPQLAANGKHHK